MQTGIGIPHPGTQGDLATHYDRFGDLGGNGASKQANSHDSRVRSSQYAPQAVREIVLVLKPTIVYAQFRTAMH